MAAPPGERELGLEVGPCGSRDAHWRPSSTAHHLSVCARREVGSRSPLASTRSMASSLRQDQATGFALRADETF